MKKSINLLSNLPTDVLVEILSRLPFKSFNRLKTVSKSWFSLTFDPYYRKKLPKPPSALIYESLDLISNKREIHYTKLTSSAPSINTPFNFLPYFEHVEISDYSHGLFLCFCSNYSSNIKRLFVCNPVNERYFALPNPNDFDFKLVLAFDPRVSKHFHVVKFLETKINMDNSVIMGLESFSSKSKIWIQKQIQWRLEIENAPKKHVFHNGIIYKLVNKDIMAIKLEDLSMELINLPYQATSRWYDRVGISDKSIIYMVKKADEILIWSLSKNNEWTFKHCLKITNIFGSNAYFFRHYPRVISFHLEHDDILFFTGGKEISKIFSYDCSSGEILCDICNLGSNIVIRAFFYVPCYVDSFSENNS